jgi:uncharacterized repeat protein (TIGR01451 family)
MACWRTPVSLHKANCECWRRTPRCRKQLVKSQSSPTRRRRRAFFKIAIALAAVWALLGAGVQPANASHFRYGHYFWKSLGGSDIEFTLQNAWRRSANPCIDPATQSTVACSAPDGLPAVGDVIVENTGGTNFSTGDGGTISSPMGALEYLVTAIDPAQDFLFGLALNPASLPAVDTTITHTYATGGDFLAFTDSCCRIGNLINNAGGGYRVETLVNVGSGNSSPVSALPPIVQCPINGLCSFLVPGSDPDGDPLQFRLSTSSEASSFGPFTQPGPPSAPNAASIDANTGQYTWDTTGASLASAGDTLYSTQVTIEDRDPLTGGVKSKVALDFIIKLTATPGVPPQFDSPPTPPCGSTLTVAPGNALTFTVSASDADMPVQVVTLNAAGLPAGAAMTPTLPTTGNPVTSTFSWTPTAAQTGSHVVTFTATDDTGLQALCSLTIMVSGPGPDLAITKADAPDPVTLGSNLTYTLTVTNNGPDPSTDSTVTDTLPAGVTFMSATPSQGSCSQLGGTVTCTLGPLAVGASATIEIVVTVDATAVCPLSDTATVVGAETDPVANNNSATAETACGVEADLAITKTDAPDPVTVGGTLTYTLTVTNNGPDPSTDSTVTDTLPAGVTFVSATPSQGSCSESGGTVTCPLGPLAGGASATIEIVVTVTATAVSPLSDTGTVAGVEADPVASNNSATAETTISTRMLDHFKCYKTKQVGDRFDPRRVILTDQFNTERVNVVRPDAFCTPVDKDGSGINDPTAHLTCYKIRDVRGDEFPKFKRQRVDATDQFGTHTLLLKKIKRLCVPSSKSPEGEVPGPLPTGLDHFKCYKTKQVGARFDPRRVVLTDQFGTERVNVVRPEAFCTPVDKDGSGISDPSAHLTCYKIGDVRGDEFPKFRKRRVEAGDQFGTHTLLLKKTRTLCLPSSKTVL